MGNKVLILISFILWAALSFAQKDKMPYLLVTDSLWEKELFKFPIHFAPELDYKGFEDARFPKGWSNQDSTEYWSYIFAWYIDGNIVITKEILENNLQRYFDGLMNAVNKNKDLEVPKSTIGLKKIDKNNFKGKISLYNAFHTKEMMFLNALVTVNFCNEFNKSLLVFRFSPSDFDFEIWEKLEKIKLREDICKVDLEID